LIIAKMVRSNEESLVAIDGTGFSLNARSPYFCTIAGERNQFMQTNAAAEIKRRLIIAVRLRRKKRHENIDVPYLMRESSKQMPITAFLADKGFDSEKNHELAEKQGTILIAPLRRANTPVRRTKGIHRKKLRREFPHEIYHQRVIIESIFSAIKRRFGHQIYSKKFITQKNELLFRIIAYNSERLINLSLRFTFYKAYYFHR
jgi:hypothetical protein